VYLIAITAGVGENGKHVTGWEQITLKAGKSTPDGYVCYSVENYRISDRVYPGNESIALKKQEGAVSRVTVRVPTNGALYLVDEVRLAPAGDYVAYEDFDEKASGIPAIYINPTGTTEGTSETYHVNLLPHSQTKYQPKKGNVLIAGSGERGLYFPDVSLLPATTYRISADITTDANYSVSVKPFLCIEGAENTYGPVTDLAAGETKHIEYLFRTSEYSGKAYSESGILYKQIGFVSKGTYVIWYADNFKIEKVPEIVCGGDMENLTVNDSGAKVYQNTYFGETLTMVAARGGADTVLEPIKDDGTNGVFGDYLKLHFMGSKNPEAVKPNANDRRGAWYVNLKKNTEYRISFRAKIVTENVQKTAYLAAMHNIGKVDKNGRISGEDGFDSTTAKYGYIDSINGKVKLTNQWQKVSGVFTTQNRHEVGQLLLGISNFKPDEDITIAMDDLSIEEIENEIHDASLSLQNGELVTNASYGKGVKSILHTLYISDDGEHFAKVAESENGTFPVLPFFGGKMVKTEVTGINPEGMRILAETNSVRMEGYNLALKEHEGAFHAQSYYFPENGETEAFTLVIAQYGEKNQMVKIDYAESQENGATLSVPKEERASCAKAFVWDMKTLKPKTEAAE